MIHLIWLLNLAAFIWLLHETNWKLELILYDMQTDCKLTAQMELESVIKQKTRPNFTFDFRDDVYRNEWLGAFNGGYSYWLENYIEIATKANFAIPGKECMQWWQSYIKAAKPGSPTKPLYYGGIAVPKFQPIVKPDYPSYHGRGFGFLIVCFSIPEAGDWLKDHYAKYPNGELPEQTIIKSRR